MMGIEQTKTPTAPAHAHGAPKATDKSRPTASGAASASPTDFASLLASADEAVMSPQGTNANDTGQPSLVQTPPKAAENARGRGSLQERKELSRTKEATVQDASVSPVSAEAPQDEEASSMVASSLLPLSEEAACMPGMVVLAPEFAHSASVESASTDASVGAVHTNGGNSKGLASTLQLQQPLGVATGAKTAGGAQAGLLRECSDGAQEVVATAVSSRSDFLHDLTIKVPPRGGGELASAPVVMELVGSIISRHQARSEGRESEGQMTSQGAIVGESTTPNQPDFADWAGGIQATDELVSEPVRFWLGSEQTQLADMTVDDIGGGSVDVTIRLQGKEAHVAFRADESLARDALQSGSGQLKELLSQEGLTLSGLSVGTSADNSAFSGDGQKQKQAAVAVSKGLVARSGTLSTDTVSGVAVPRPGVTGRGVDLYV